MSTPLYGKAFDFSLSLVDMANRPSFKSSPTIATGDFKISKDGGAFTNLMNTPTVSPAGGVRVAIELTATEMMGRDIAIYVHDVAGAEWDDVFINISPLTNDVVIFTGDALASVNQICNLALSHLGVGKPIEDFETDTTQEAEACRMFFVTARDTALRGFPWPFATKTEDLTLVEELTADTDEWGFSYRYPSDCLKIRRILSGIRNDTRQSRVPYKVGRDDTGQLIYCDQEDARAEYTLQATDPSLYPIDFSMALSYYLAHLIAPRLTKGDPFKLGDKSLQLYYMALQKAEADSMGEEQVDEEADSQFIRERE